MSPQWEIDLILNIWFTCLRLNLSCTIHSRTPIKSKIGGKILSQNYVNQALTSFQLILNPFFMKPYALLHPASWSNMLKIKFSKQILILVL